MAYACQDAKRDIALFFRSTDYEGSAERALTRALSHMVSVENDDSHVVVCEECWSYYMDQKRTYCGG